MEKRFSILLTFLLGYCSLHAQVKKGQYMLGGNAAIEYSSKRNPNFSHITQKNTTFSFSPQLGIGLKKNWVVGGGLNLQMQKVVHSDTNTYKNNLYALIAFVRKFHPFTEQFGIYLQLDAGVGKGIQEIDFDWQHEKIDHFNYSVYLRPGLYYKAGNKINLEAGLGNIGYNSSFRKTEHFDVNDEGFSFNVFNYINIGFYYIF